MKKVKIEVRVRFELKYSDGARNSDWSNYFLMVTPYEGRDLVTIPEDKVLISLAGEAGFDITIYYKNNHHVYLRIKKGVHIRKKNAFVSSVEEICGLLD